MSEQTAVVPTDLPPVEYRDLAILGFPGYRVGSDGSVQTSWQPGRRAAPYKTRWRNMKPRGNSEGYLYLLLNCADGSRLLAVHRLVLEAFLGPCPAGMEACHYPDRSPDNNALHNLRWDTHSENNKDVRRDCPLPLAKVCCVCCQIKPLGEFYLCRRFRDGRQTACAACQRVRACKNRKLQRAAK